MLQTKFSQPYSVTGNIIISFIYSNFRILPQKLSNNNNNNNNNNNDNDIKYLEIDNEEMKKVNKFKYLGSILEYI